MDKVDSPPSQLICCGWLPQDRSTTTLRPPNSQPFRNCTYSTSLQLKSLPALVIEWQDRAIPQDARIMPSQLERTETGIVFHRTCRMPAAVLVARFLRTQFSATVTCVDMRYLCGGREGRLLFWTPAQPMADRGALGRRVGAIGWVCHARPQAHPVTHKPWNALLRICWLFTGAILRVERVIWWLPRRFTLPQERRGRCCARPYSR